MNQHNRDMLQHYFNFWEREDERRSSGVSLSEAAYNILVNTGRLYRSGDQNVLDAIKSGDKDNLINKGLEYAQKLTIFSDLEDIEDIETLIEYRDELEVALNTISLLIKPDVYAGDFSILSKVSVLRGKIVEFDQKTVN